jgi:hypothetical protein
MPIYSHVLRALAACGLFLFAHVSAQAQDGKAVYDQLKTFSLSGGQANVTNLVLKRDRVEMTLTGTIYFSADVSGKTTGAVFIGDGVFSAPLPPNPYERANVKKLLDIDSALTSDFKTAVFRFSDGTANILGKDRSPSTASPQAVALAAQFDQRIRKETGINLPARIALSILNQERQGFFFGTFDGGKRGRFSYVYDAQNRVPTDYFDINAGERGLIFKYDASRDNNDVWMAFHSLSDYTSGMATYSDLNSLVDITHYDIDLDLTAPKKRMGLRTAISMQVKVGHTKAIPFIIGEGLSADSRNDRQMHIEYAKVGGMDVAFAQEERDGGFLIFLPAETSAAENLTLEIKLSGDFLTQPTSVGIDNSYPVSNTSWYPRHGYLDRASFSLTFKHSKQWKVAAVGTRVSERPSETEKDVVITRYEMPHPVPFATFALGEFQRHTEMIKWESGAAPTPLEFNSIGYRQIEEPFMMAEMNNSVRYFAKLFGPYPYETYGAAFHPYGFGQGLPSLLMLPDTDRDNTGTFAFIAHETAHQWWGNTVAWRSYRDQWLSEGFAEYSGVLYAGLRKNHDASKKLVDDMRLSLRSINSPSMGVGKGKLADLGPIILGHRLASKRSVFGYQTLIYNKGGLVLRMLHFLFTDPTTGDGQPFFDMMRAFTDRYREKTASTEDFQQIANEYFRQTPIARQHGLTDLNWFFREWVYEADLPSFQLKYQVDAEAGGTFLTGTVTQEGVPGNWENVLPVVMKFGGKQAVATILAAGPSSTFRLKIPQKPDKVELDPDRWIVSDKTSTQ